MPSEFDRAIRQARARIDDVDGPMRQMMAETYANAVRNLSYDLEQVTALIEQARDLGIDVNLDWLRRQDRYIRLIDQAERQFARFADDGVRLIESGRVRAIRGGAAEAWELMEASGMDVGFRGSINTIAVENTVAATYSGPVRDILNGYGPANAKTITDTLVTGMAQGHSPRKMIREIQRGIHGPYSKARLEALVRTEAMRGFRAGLDEQYSTMSHLIAGYRWCAALSSRTCLACLGMHGKVRKETWDRFHVQCRCISSPVVKGVTIPFPSSEDWMRRQSPATQARMFPSREALQAWRDKSVSLEDFVGTTTDRVWGKAVYQRSGRRVLEGVNAKLTTPPFVPSKSVADAAAIVADMFGGES